MADRAAIIDMMNKWAYGYDAPELDLMADCFTEDASVTIRIAGGDPIGPFEGREGIMKLMSDSLATQNDQRRHVTTNYYFPEESDDQARVISYLSLIVVAEGKLEVKSSGVYHDLVVNEAGTWRIRERLIALDLPY
jgi:hypothetical protein